MTDRWGTDRWGTDRWAAELADTLDEVARRLARLAESVALDWPDERGREWTERAGHLHRELAQRASAAAELGAQLAHSAESPLHGGGWGAATSRSGVRLGAVGGHRVDDERGMRIAELPPG